MQPRVLCGVFAAALVLGPFGSDAARADYSVPPAYDMLGASELVVVGRIQKLAPRTYDLKVQKVIAGKTPKRVLRIKRFQNWTCAARWTPYAVGQKMVVLLSRKGATSPWIVRSAGGEGEAPVVGKHVYLRGLWLRTPKSGKYKLGASLVYGQRLTLAAFTKLVRGLRKCFRFTVDKKRWFRLTGARRICSAKALRTYTRRGSAELWLVKAVKARFKIP